MRTVGENRGSAFCPRRRHVLHQLTNPLTHCQVAARTPPDEGGSEDGHGRVREDWRQAGGRGDNEGDGKDGTMEEGLPPSAKRGLPPPPPL